MSKTKAEALATITITFRRDGDASFGFDVNEDVKLPTMADAQTIVFAKLVYQLIGGLIASEAIPQIHGLVERANRPSYDEED